MGGPPRHASHSQPIGRGCLFIGIPCEIRMFRAAISVPAAGTHRERPWPFARPGVSFTEPFRT